MSGTIWFIGGGKMAEAMISGLIASAGAPTSESDGLRYSVVEPVEQRRATLLATFASVHVVADLQAVEPNQVESAVIAVKPGDVPAACASLRSVLAPGARVLSIAAGVSIQQLEDWLGPDAAVIRAMPNTPALVGRGAAAFAAGTRASDADRTWARSTLEAVGIALEVPEAKLDAVTGLSGSGPAYVFLVAEALIEGGVLAGLPRATAEQLTAQTLLGAATLLAGAPATAATLRADVTSPAGTTAAGLRALESAGVRSAFIEAVSAATARATELRG